MSADLIAELRELLRRSTPGPWAIGGPWPSVCVYSVCEECIDRETNGGDPDAVVAELGTTKEKDCRAHPDAALIVAAVNALPALLDVVEAAKRLYWSEPDADGNRCGLKPSDPKNRALWDALSRLSTAPTARGER